MWLFLFPIIIIIVASSILISIYHITVAICEKDVNRIINLFKGWGLVLLYISLFITLIVTVNFLRNPTNVEIDDIYGEYTIHRGLFKGKQNDWQYNSFKFIVNRNNTYDFYYLDKGKVINKTSGNVEFTKYGVSPHIKFIQAKNTPYIFKENPTLYRKTWSFYYVFHTKKYGNVFFKKRKWKSIE